MKRFICWYSYQGMETEGNLCLEDPWITKAEDKAEAMWKWHNHRGVDMKDAHGTLEEFRKIDFLGWGMWCEELADE